MTTKLFHRNTEARSIAAKRPDFGRNEFLCCSLMFFSVAFCASVSLW